MVILTPSNSSLKSTSADSDSDKCAISENFKNFQQNQKENQKQLEQCSPQNKYLTCNVQYYISDQPKNTSADLNSGKSATSPKFNHRETKEYAFLAQIPLSSQMSALVKFLNAPLKPSDAALQILRIKSPSTPQISCSSRSPDFLETEREGVQSDVEFGNYLDLESSLEEQIDEIFDNNSNNNFETKVILALKTNLSIRVNSIIEELSNTDGRALRHSLFALKQLFQEDKDLVQEFIIGGGFITLLAIGKNGDQNIQNYILRILGQIMLFVDGMRGLSQDSNLLIWLYSLVNSQFRLVSKTSLKLLLLFVEYSEENIAILLNLILNSNSEKPLKSLVWILDEREFINDSEILTYAFTFINKFIAFISQNNYENPQEISPEAKNFENFHKNFKSTGNLTEICNKNQNNRNISPLNNNNNNNVNNKSFFAELIKVLESYGLSHIAQRHLNSCSQHLIETSSSKLNTKNSINLTNNNENFSNNINVNVNMWSELRNQCNKYLTLSTLSQLSTIAKTQQNYVTNNENGLTNNENNVNIYENNVNINNEYPNSHKKNECMNGKNDHKPYDLQNGRSSFQAIQSIQKYGGRYSDKNFMNNNSNNNKNNNFFDKNQKTPPSYATVSWRDRFKQSDLVTSRPAKSKTDTKTSGDPISCSSSISDSRNFLNSYNNGMGQSLPQSKSINGHSETFTKKQNSISHANNYSQKTNLNHYNNNYQSTNINDPYSDRNSYLTESKTPNSHMSVKTAEPPPFTAVSGYGSQNLNQNISARHKFQALESTKNGGKTADFPTSAHDEASFTKSHVLPYALTNVKDFKPLNTLNVSNNNYQNTNNFVNKSQNKFPANLKETLMTNGQNYSSYTSEPSDSRNYNINFTNSQFSTPSNTPSTFQTKSSQSPVFSPYPTQNSPSFNNLNNNSNNNINNNNSNICSSEPQKSSVLMSEWEKIARTFKRPLRIGDLDFTNLTSADDEFNSNNFIQNEQIIENNPGINVKNTFEKPLNTLNLNNNFEISHNKKGNSNISTKGVPLAPPPPSPPMGGIPAPPPLFGLTKNGNLSNKNGYSSMMNTNTNTLKAPGKNNALQHHQKNLSTSTLNLSTSNGANNMNSRKTLRLFWRELKSLPQNNNQSSKICLFKNQDCCIWNRRIPNLKIDYEKLEQLFETKAKDIINKNKTEVKKSQILVLDSKRSNAINIGMTKLPPARAIKTAIYKMDSSIINREGIEKILSTMIPSEEEKQLILEAQLASPELPLGTAEQFLLTLSSVSELEARLKLWAFKLDYETIERDIAEPLMDLLNGIEELKNNKTLPLILNVCLAVGNFLNGTQCFGFHIEYLGKLPEIKDTVTKQSLLFHVCDIVLQHCPQSSDLYSDLGSIVRSSRVDFEELENTLKKTEQLCKDSWNHLKAIVKYETGPVLKIRMSEFLNDCAGRIMVLQIVHRRLLNRYKRLLQEFFGIPIIPSSGGNNSAIRSPDIGGAFLGITKFCRIITDFALEYKTVREKILESLKKKQISKERNLTRGKMIIDSIKKIPTSIATSFRSNITNGGNAYIETNGAFLSLALDENQVIVTEPMKSSARKNSNFNICNEKNNGFERNSFTQNTPSQNAKLSLKSFINNSNNNNKNNQIENNFKNINNKISHDRNLSASGCMTSADKALQNILLGNSNSSSPSVPFYRKSPTYYNKISETAKSDDLLSCLISSAVCTQNSLVGATKQLTNYNKNKNKNVSYNENFNVNNIGRRSFNVKR